MIFSCRYCLLIFFDMPLRFAMMPRFHTDAAIMITLILLLCRFTLLLLRRRFDTPARC